MSYDIRHVAKDFIDQGWAVVPLVHGEKRANTRWRSRVYTPNDFNADDGIAGKCGEPSGWRVDVDLDASEAIEAARDLLPATQLIHGRAAKPDSHYWYICAGATPHVWKDVKDAAGGTATLVEIRSTGGYTVLPPSGHPSGDTLTWTVQRQALVIDPDELTRAVRNVAIATLLARHWPGPGARHHAVGHIAGFLLRYGVEPIFVQQIVSAAARVARDPDLHDRINFVNATIAKWQGDKDAALTGGPKLADALGDDVVVRLRSWLGASDDDAIEQMNQKHFVTTLESKTVIGREENGHPVVFQRPAELYPLYANRVIKVGDRAQKNGDVQPIYKPLFEAWLESKHRREYARVVNAPPPFTCTPEEYNLWKGFAIEPAPGDCSLFLDHLRNVICGGNDEHYRYLIAYLALLIQQPGTLPEVAVVMRGEPGTGKGTLVRALGSIVGPHHFAHLDRVDELVKWTSQLSGKVVVFADEAFWAGDKREIGTLKRNITEPTIRISRKHVDSHEERNTVHLFMATNEDWAIPAQMRERRFFAVNVSNARRRDTAYFNALKAEMSNGGLAAFMHSMLQESTSIEIVRQVPDTRELRFQQSKTLAPHHRWWQECLYEGEIPTFDKWPGGQLVESARLYRLYRDQVIDRYLDKTEFSIAMGRLIFSDKIRKQRIRGNSQKHPVRCATVRALDDARRAFDAEVGSVNDWPDDEVPASQIGLPVP